MDCGLLARNRLTTFRQSRTVDDQLRLGVLSEEAQGLGGCDIGAVAGRLQPQRLFMLQVDGERQNMPRMDALAVLRSQMKRCHLVFCSGGSATATEKPQSQAASSKAVTHSRSPIAVAGSSPATRGRFCGHREVWHEVVSRAKSKQPHGHGVRSELTVSGSTG